MTTFSDNPHWNSFNESLSREFGTSLRLPERIVRDLRPTIGAAVGTEHFSDTGIFDPLAAYGLDFGRREIDAGLTDISLREYFGRWPDKPNMFQYIDRSNGLSTMAGILVRTSNVLISMQWTIGSQAESQADSKVFNWFYFNAFNDYGCQLLDHPHQPTEKTIVVFSDYRQHCYLATNQVAQWDLDASDVGVLQPLPDDMQLAGNWSNSVDDTRRVSLEERVDLLSSPICGDSDLLSRAQRLLLELSLIDLKRISAMRGIAETDN